MPINIGQPFKRTSSGPIDMSLTLTKAEMLAVKDSEMPAKYFTICQEDGQVYLYDKSATPSAQTGKFKLLEAGGTESMELTQAEYDALSDDEKNNGTIYFITDGQGGGTAYQAGEGIDITNDTISVKDEFVKWNTSHPLGSSATLTSFKNWQGDDGVGLFQISTGGNGPNGAVAVGDMDINLWANRPNNNGARVEFFACKQDGNGQELVGAIDVYDTGWKNGDGYKYRVKNGLLFVAFGDWTAPVAIPAETTHVMGTLPQEYRPGTRDLAVVIAGGVYANASVETNGEVRIAIKTAVSAGSSVPLRGQLIAIM